MGGEEDRKTAWRIAADGGVFGVGTSRDGDHGRAGRGENDIAEYDPGDCAGEEGEVRVVRAVGTGGETVEREHGDGGVYDSSIAGSAAGARICAGRKPAAGGRPGGGGRDEHGGCA